MYCMSCGAEIPEDSAFCTSCGAPVAELSELPAEPVPAEYPVPAYVDYEAPVSPTNVLVWAILGLAFACTFYLSFLGIIFSAIGIGKFKTYTTSGAPYSTKVKVGGILSKVGLGVGIGLTVLFLIYIIVIVGMLVWAGRSIPLAEIISELI